MTDGDARSPAGCQFAVGGLVVAIERRHAADADDYWDGNWLVVTAECRSEQSTVCVSGPILHLSEVAAFRTGCERLAAGEADEAGLFCMEPNLKIELWRVPDGRLIGKIRITPDHKSELHDFGFALEGSSLNQVVADCTAVLAAYPLRGKGPRGQ